MLCGIRKVFILSLSLVAISHAEEVFTCANKKTPFNNSTEIQKQDNPNITKKKNTRPINPSCATRLETIFKSDLEANFSALVFKTLVQDRAKPAQPEIDAAYHYPDLRSSYALAEQEPELHLSGSIDIRAKVNDFLHGVHISANGQMKDYETIPDFNLLDAYLLWEGKSGALHAGIKKNSVYSDLGYCAASVALDEISIWNDIDRLYLDVGLTTAPQYFSINKKAKKMLLVDHYTFTKYDSPLRISATYKFLDSLTAAVGSTSSVFDSSGTSFGLLSMAIRYSDTLAPIGLEGFK